MVRCDNESMGGAHEGKHIKGDLSGPVEDTQEDIASPTPSASEHMSTPGPSQPALGTIDHPDTLRELIDFLEQVVLKERQSGRSVILHNLTGVPLRDELTRFVWEFSHHTNNRTGSNVIWWIHQLDLYMNMPPSQSSLIVKGGQLKPPGGISSGSPDPLNIGPGHQGSEAQLFEVEVKVEEAEEVEVGVVGEEVEVEFQDSEMGEEAAEDGSTANHDEEGAEVEVEEAEEGGNHGGNDDSESNSDSNDNNDDYDDNPRDLDWNPEEGTPGASTTESDTGSVEHGRGRGRGRSRGRGHGRGRG